MFRFGDERPNPAPFEIARLGVGLVPEGRQIFPNLSVKENLTVFSRTGYVEHKWDLDRILSLFPTLENRLHHRGNELSGGEQQMLAIGRALMTNPRLLILDEATEGLAPIISQQIWHCLDTLKQTGQSILVVDKNLSALLKLCDQHYIIDKGHIIWEGNSAVLSADTTLQNRYLGI